MCYSPNRLDNSANGIYGIWNIFLVIDPGIGLSLALRFIFVFKYSKCHRFLYNYLVQRFSTYLGLLFIYVKNKQTKFYNSLLT